MVKSAFTKPILVAVPLLLAACAITQPIQFKNVAEPQAVPIELLQSDKSVVVLVLGSGGSRGNTGKAVRASSSIPGVHYPVKIGDEEYVDGDPKSPVAVSVAEQMGADMVIAVEIPQQPADNPLPEDIIDILKQSIRSCASRSWNMDSRLRRS